MRERLADANLLVEDERGQFARSRKLRGAARQHDAAADDLVEARSLKAVAHQLERFLERAAR